MSFLSPPLIVWAIRTALQPSEPYSRRNNEYVVPTPTVASPMSNLARSMMLDMIKEQRAIEEKKRREANRDIVAMIAAAIVIASVIIYFVI